MKYYDDVALRQSVEKQLSHIDMMNRFAKAIFFGNNGTGCPAPATRQEFTVATKEE